MKKENKDLKNAKRDRQLDATKSRIMNELKRLKIRKYYESPALKSISVQRKLKDGTEKHIKSFKVEIKRKNDVIKADKLLDGVCVFTTNHIERQGEHPQFLTIIEGSKGKAWLKFL